MLYWPDFIENKIFCKILDNIMKKPVIVFLLLIWLFPFLAHGENSTMDAVTALSVKSLGIVANAAIIVGADAYTSSVIVREGSSLQGNISRNVCASASVVNAALAVNAYANLASLDIKDGSRTTVDTSTEVQGFAIVNIAGSPTATACVGGVVVE